MGQARCDMWLALQLKHRCAQGFFIEPASTSGSKCVLIALTAADLFTSVFANSGSAEGPAFPAQRVALGKQTGGVPTSRAGNAVMTRLDTAAADSAGLRIDEGER